MSPNATYVVCGAGMELLQGDSTEPIVRLAAGDIGTCYQPRFSPDGSHIAWGNQHGKVFLCHVSAVLEKLKSARLVK